MTEAVLPSFVIALMDIVEANSKFSKTVKQDPNLV
jgi:hypothetical protein